MTQSKKLNIEIPQGTLYELEIGESWYSLFVDDLSLYDVKSHIRKHHSSNSYMEFTSNTESGNNILLSIDSNTTLEFESGRYYYDVLLVPKTGDNGPFRIQEGVVLLTPSITIV